MTRIAQVDRSATPVAPIAQTDSSPTDRGNWETSGIIDVSSLFDQAPGQLFLLDVEAHSLRDGVIADRDLDGLNTGRNANLVEGGQISFLAKTTDLLGTSGRDTNLTGSSGNDRIVGGTGADILTGGAGFDVFAYNSIRDAGDRILDFDLGVDKIDLSGLLDTLGYTGTNAIAAGYVRVVAGSAANTVGVELDSNGGGDSFRSFITVQGDGVTATNVSTVNNFIF